MATVHETTTPWPYRPTAARGDAVRRRGRVPRELGEQLGTETEDWGGGGGRSRGGTRMKKDNRACIGLAG